jgi:hypothetical protein
MERPDAQAQRQTRTCVNSGVRFKLYLWSRHRANLTREMGCAPVVPAYGVGTPRQFKDVNAWNAC